MNIYIVYVHLLCIRKHWLAKKLLTCAVLSLAEVRAFITKVEFLNKTIAALVIAGNF